METAERLLSSVLYGIQGSPYRHLAYKWADIPYKAGSRDPKHRLDAYVPITQQQISRPKSCILFLHGGGWCRGDKEWDHTGLWSNLGYAFAGRYSIPTFIASYRLAPDVCHPHQIADVAAAFNWVVMHADRYGADPKRVWICGHSAGGHLGALLSADPRWCWREGIRPCMAGFIGVGGPYNLPRLAYAPFGAYFFTHAAFGDHLATLTAASPVYALSRASPLCRIPVLLATAEEDWYLPQDAAELDAAIHAAQHDDRCLIVNRKVDRQMTATGSYSDLLTQEMRLLEPELRPGSLPLLPDSPGRAVRHFPTSAANVSRVCIEGTNHFSVLTGAGRVPGRKEPLLDLIAHCVRRQS